ncbi:hypothetical protein KR018_003248, partial [Drosophila ironensis]
QSIGESELEQLFEKKFKYRNPQDNSNWTLPTEEQSLCSEFYQYKALQLQREQLNAVKSKLNDYGTQEWSSHTNRCGPSGEVTWRLKKETKAEFVTVAWCKMFECLHRYPLLPGPVVNSVHLCEAPGAFMAALNHYLHSSYDENEIQWRWRSTTLNPYYEGNSLKEMVADDRFIFHTLENWLFHEDLTGNLLSVANIEHLAGKCAESFQGKVDLVTADGSIDCAAQPDCQEEIVVRLFFAEVLAALKILSKGGSLLVKMFTLFEACSVSLLYMLNCVFQQVEIFKPATSKRGNSEVYIVCLKYKKDSPGLERVLAEIQTKLAHPNDTMLMPLFAKSQIPEDFLKQHEDACRLFANWQASAIEKSIYAYESNDRNYLRQLHRLRSLVSKAYYARYKVKRLEDRLCIVDKKSTSKAVGFWVPFYGGSYTERESFRDSDLLKKVYCLRREFNLVEKSFSAGHTYPYTRDQGRSLQLMVSRGAPVRSLQSSMFASEPIMLLRLRILDTFGIDPVWQTAPRCQIDPDNTLNYQPPSSDDETFQSAQSKFFVELLEAIKKHRPERIVFQGFLFLTHYAVSVLLFLMETVYEECHCDKDPLHSLTLSKLKCADNSAVVEVLDLLTDNQQELAIHTIFSIKELHKNPISCALIQHNNNVLLTCFRGMLAEEAFPRPVAIAATSGSGSGNGSALT